MEFYVLEAVRRYSLLDGGERNVTVALSGGADSMALLHALNNLKGELGITLSAAHLNHMIRGDEAYRDEEFVKRQCAALDIPLFTERADIPKIAADMGISTELAARWVRYEFLERVSKGFIATAHTASDNLETVLFNITRGSALNGLCGIPAKRGRIIRPLLLCTRAQIEEYCEKNGIPYVFDSTNSSDDYTRNKIRHNAVPVLKEINPSVEIAVLRMCDSVREDSLLLETRAQKYITDNTAADGTLNLKGFRDIPPAVGKRIIKKYVENSKFDITLENNHIESAYYTALNGGRTSIPKNCFAVAYNNRFSVENDALKTSKNTEICVNLSEAENTFFKNGEKINNLFLNNALDCDKIIGKLVIRTRKSGDSIRLRNRGCTKTLNRLFSESRIPVNLRDSFPVIADDKGVVWVYKAGVASRCAVTAAAKKVILIKTED